MSTRKTVFILMLTLCLSATGQISLNNRPAVLDTLTGTMLVSVPEADFGLPYTARINFNDKIEQISINGTTLANGDNITFPVVDANARYQVTFYEPAPVTRTIQFTFLPIVDIQGTIAKTYNIITANVYNPDGKLITGPSKVKFRGSSINSNRIQKRGYHIKFVDNNGEKREEKLLGLRNDNSWILDGGTFDFIRIRNRVLTDLWLDMAAKPYYADREPSARSGVRGAPVEVFRNNEYQGFYLLTEALDRKQMKLEKLDENTNTIYGLLYKSSKRSPETRMMQTSPYDNNSATWGGFEIKYPDLDDLCPTDYSVMFDAVHFVANSTDSAFIDSIKHVLDMPVIVDYYVFLETTFAYDNEGKNMYWACYDQNRSRMITPAVWDLDATLGQYHAPTYFHPNFLDENISLINFDNPQDNYLLRLIKLNPDRFRQQARDRYRQLRDNLLSHQSIMARFDHYLDLLSRSGATDREQARYNRHSDLNFRTLNLSQERDFIDQWLARRLEFLDNALFAQRENGDVNDDGSIDIGDLNALINILLGRETDTPEADIDHNGKIDIADINALITLITHRP